MNDLISQILMSLAASVAFLTLTAGCEAPEYQEDDSLDIVLEIQ